MEFVDLKPETAFDDAIKTIDGNEKLVVCGSAKDTDGLQDNLEFDYSASEIIESSKNINILEWFTGKRDEFEEDWEIPLTDNEGEWPGEIKDKPGFTLCRDVLSNNLIQDLVGTKIKCDESWHILAYFNYGGWNDCPEASLHCAIWKYWEDKYGAKIVGVSGDIIEAYVLNPPKSKEEAMELAWEQYLYCYDIVDQGVETVSNLAALLLNSKAWYFWWD